MWTAGSYCVEQVFSGLLCLSWPHSAALSSRRGRISFPAWVASREPCVIFGEFMGRAAFGTTGPFGKGNGGSKEDDFRSAGNRFSSRLAFPSTCISFPTSCSWKTGYLAAETLAWNLRELNKSPGPVRSPGVFVQEVSWSLGLPWLNRDNGSSLCVALWDESLQGRVPQEWGNISDTVDSVYWGILDAASWDLIQQQNATD